MLRVLPGSDFGVSFRCVFRSLFHANASCYLLPATRYCLLPTCYLLLATRYPLTATRFLQCAACDQSSKGSAEWRRSHLNPPPLQGRGVLNALQKICDLLRNLEG